MLTQVRPLTDPQRRALQVELHKVGFTPDEILKRARSVALDPDREYGNIGLQYWLKDRILTSDIVDYAVAIKLRTILGELMLRVKHPDADEVGDMALARLEWEYEEEFRKMLESQVEKIEQQVKAARERIVKMSDVERKKLLTVATKQKIFAATKTGEIDPIILQNITVRAVVLKLLPLMKGKP